MPTPCVCVTILRIDELHKVSKFGTYLNKQTLYVIIRISQTFLYGIRLFNSRCKGTKKISTNQKSDKKNNFFDCFNTFSTPLTASAPN